MKMEIDGGGGKAAKGAADTTENDYSSEGGNEFHELYNSERASQPLKKIEEKWKLVPAFLRLRGLVKQHIDSFNHFLNIGIKEIINANAMMTSEHDHRFYLKFNDINVDMPRIDEDCVQHELTPHECRVRDMTYSAPIFVDIEYTLGNQIMMRKVEIGRMPMMLGASNCWLKDMTHDQLARVKECPYDPRGYFIVKGVEKVLLIQEQMSKNRIIIEQDQKKNFCAQVTSSTYMTKSRTTIVHKNDKFYLKHNKLADDIPIVIAFKAMGMQCD
jgi:DNA-directed RNA polymerase III subunit RPC2